MDHINVEKLIKYIKARPGMYMEEERVDYAYYFISGYMFRVSSGRY